MAKRTGKRRRKKSSGAKKSSARRSARTRKKTSSRKKAPSSKSTSSGKRSSTGSRARAKPGGSRPSAQASAGTQQSDSAPAKQALGGQAAAPSPVPLERSTPVEQPRAAVRVTAPVGALVRGVGWLAGQWRRLPVQRIRWPGVRSAGNLALGALLVLLVLVLLLLFLVGRTPGYYRDPGAIGDEQLIRWGEGFVGKANQLLTHVVNREAFTVAITEEEVNGYLASFFRPEVREALSAKLSEEEWFTVPSEWTGLMVHLGEEEVVLAARYGGSRFRPVVSLTGTLTVSDEGELHFCPARLRAGWLPLAMRWVPGVVELGERPISLVKTQVHWERVTVSEGAVELAARYSSSAQGGRSSREAR